MRRVDFATAYGRLGTHPGDVGPVEAEAIFSAAEGFLGGNFLEVSPNGGRGTAILATAAANVGGHLDVALDQFSDPALARWLALSVRLRRLSDFASFLSAIPTHQSYDLVLCRGGVPHGVKLAAGGRVLALFFDAGLAAGWCSIRTHGSLTELTRSDENAP